MKSTLLNSFPRILLWMLVSTIPLIGYSRDLTGRPASPTGTSAFSLFQTTTVTGKITDDTGVGMPGVNILVKGTSIGTTSDVNGDYAIGIPSGQSDAVLVFSFIGYVTQEQSVSNRTAVNVSLIADVRQLSEVVVVGYGTQEKRDVTASISSISSEDIQKIPSTNALDAMKGQIAGVDVLQGSGRPGDSPRITIRGRRSINASNDPLIVVDGVPMTSGTSTDNNGNITTSGTDALLDFNPQDIESLEVLKDAAATAIYGSRGANGVILITTKRGKTGKTTVNYTGTYGVSQAFSDFPMMNGQQFADLKREANRISPGGVTGRTAWEGTIPGDDVVFIDPVELQSATEGRSTDWQDLIFQNGDQTNQQLSVAGGSEKTQFNLALNYFKENGIVSGVDFTKYTARINVDHQISKYFKAGLSLLYSNSIQNFGSGSVISEAVNQTPLGVPRDDEGNLIFLPISDGIRSNPLNELVPGKRIDEREIDRVFGSVYLEVTPIKGLSYKFLFGPDIRYRTRGIFEGQFTNTRKNGTPFGSLESHRTQGYTMENLITYNKTLNEKHNFGITLLQSIQQQSFSFQYASADGLPYESQKWFALHTGTLSAFRTRLEEWSLASFMGRINYSYAGKYLFQATLRADGSSRLAPGNKWTNFPGLSVGWRVIDEPFMANIGFLSELKLRGSYGVVGNTSVDPYQTAGRLASSVYDWDDGNAAGFRLNEIPNPDLTWEKSETIDIGLDFGLFNGRLSGTLDYYVTNTTDLLLERNLPITSGYFNILSNIGATRTKGFEVTLSANVLDSPEGLRWDVNFNLGHYKEEIVDLAQRDADGNKTDDLGNRWFIGQPIRVFYEYKKTGIWQANEFDLAQSMMQAYPGEIKLQDTNGDGIISADDRVILGTDVPSAYGGLTNKLSYKGIDLSIFLYYRLGFTLDSRFLRDQATMQARYNNINLDYWTIDNPSNEYPRPNNNQEFPQNRESLGFVDGGFVKIRNITLGYNFPSSVTSRLKLSNLTIFVTAQNPKVWSDYKFFDPESHDLINAGDMPSTKLYLGGLSVTF